MVIEIPQNKPSISLIIQGRNPAGCCAEQRLENFNVS